MARVKDADPSQYDRTSRFGRPQQDAALRYADDAERNLRKLRKALKKGDVSTPPTSSPHSTATPPASPPSSPSPSARPQPTKPDATPKAQGGQRVTSAAPTAAYTTRPPRPAIPTGVISAAQTNADTTRPSRLGEEPAGRPQADRGGTAAPTEEAPQSVR